MTTVEKIMSLLSLDVYNRGYNPGISSDGEVDLKISEGLGFTSPVAGFEILNRSVFEITNGVEDESGVYQPGTYDAWKSINFYAQAYRATENILDADGNVEIAAGTVVVAYRGTDELGDPNIPNGQNDIATGWLLGSGTISPQAKAAVEFYNSVRTFYNTQDAEEQSATEVILNPTEIIVTGHSLGGGLAGFVGGGYDVPTYAFDAMSFETALGSIFGYGEEGSGRFEAAVKFRALTEGLVSLGMEEAEVKDFFSNPVAMVLNLVKGILEDNPGINILDDVIAYLAEEESNELYILYNLLANPLYFPSLDLGQAIGSGVSTLLALVNIIAVGFGLEDEFIEDLRFPEFEISARSDIIAENLDVVQRKNLFLEAGFREAFFDESFEDIVKEKNFVFKMFPNYNLCVYF